MITKVWEIHRNLYGENSQQFIFEFLNTSKWQISDFSVKCDSSSLFGKLEIHFLNICLVGY